MESQEQLGLLWYGHPAHALFLQQPEINIFLYNFTSIQNRRQILIGLQKNHHQRIPTNNVARIRSKSIEKRVLVVKIVLSLRRN